MLQVQNIFFLLRNVGRKPSTYHQVLCNRFRMFSYFHNDILMVTLLPLVLSQIPLYFPVYYYCIRKFLYIFNSIIMKFIEKNCILKYYNMVFTGRPGNTKIIGSTIIHNYLVHIEQQLCKKYFAVVSPNRSK